MGVKSVSEIRIYSVFEHLKEEWGCLFSLLFLMFTYRLNYSSLCQLMTLFSSANHIWDVKRTQIRFSFTSGTFHQRRLEKWVPQAHKTFGELQRVAFSVRDISTDTHTHTHQWWKSIRTRRWFSACQARRPSCTAEGRLHSFIYLLVSLRCKVCETK